jgi:arylsulfatase A-like enzyme
MSGKEILDKAGRGADANEVRGAYARAERVERDRAGVARRRGARSRTSRCSCTCTTSIRTRRTSSRRAGTLSDPSERKRGLYRQQLRYLDRQLADFFAKLDQVLAGPKVIVFTSDHGEEFFEHDDWGHGHTLYDELLHVPLFVHLPSGRAGRVEHALEARDLYTLVQDLARDPALDLEAWGATHARAVRYASQYLDRIEDARPDKKWTGLRRVEKDGLSLIWSAFGPTWQLYDERADPRELDNLIDREPARAAELRGELDSAVHFWSAPSEVSRTPEENEFLRQLGYGGGVEPGTPKAGGP